MMMLTEDQKKLLDGIVDTDTQAKVSFFHKAARQARFVLDISYAQFGLLMDNPDEWVEFDTFNWQPGVAKDFTRFKTTVRKTEIAEWSEVSDDMWVDFITTTNEQATAMKMQAMQGNGQG